MPPPPLSSLSSPSSSLPSLHSLNLTTTTTYHENSLSISTSDVRLTSSTSTLNSPFSSSLHLLTKKEKEEEETLEKKDEKMSGCPFPVSSSSSFPNVSFHNERSSSFPSASSSSSSSSSPSTLSTLSSSRLSLWSFLTNATHTFALTTLDTCQAALHHVWYGPPHTSWNLLTTLTRAALRRVMLCNPPHASHSFPLLQSFMQFTYPVSTRYQFYPVWFEIESADVKDPCVHAWHQLHMTTVLGQSKGHRISGEFVTLATPPWKGSSSSHAAFIRPLDEFVLLKDQLHHLSHPSQALTDPGSVPSQWMASRTLILYVHGGAFFFMSARTHRYITTRFAKHTNATVFAINQRLGPDHSFAASVEDVILCYLSLIGIRPCKVHATTEPKYSNFNLSGQAPGFHEVKNDPSHATPPTITQKIWLPDQIVFAGDSSGGNTVVSALLVMKSAGYPLPKSAILLSPWLDPPCTIGRTSWTENRDTCYLPMDLPGLGDHFEHFCSPFPVTHPLVCPLYATQSMLQGLPPILLQVGHHEALRDESIEWGRCVSQAGGPIRVEIYDGSFHAFHAFQFLKQGQMAFQRIHHWIHLVTLQPERALAMKCVEWIQCS